MSRYQLDVTCLRCGGQVDHVNSNTFQSDRDGDTHKTGQEPSTDTAVTVVQCVNTRCRRQWLVRVVMMEGPTTDEAKNRQTSRRRKRRNELTIPG